MVVAVQGLRFESLNKVVLLTLLSYGENGVYEVKESEFRDTTIDVIEELKERG